ncbi:complex I 24 kDa subunit family protein [Natranaerofaba carboxydovora]|uniref:NADH-quinone oxidoreductase subunit NuoE family protein n=1 Tax=Natranaerofaba carboxydovora TaxID=2742683 RepID=UPI001F12FC38|nr:NAD(P)H-dependent oxidoreductase subunit E [Natranaerofaba carboxydovora]UMZ73588.1 NADP-reducing hydrogenase subunit HndA [Natranaerofaba carboxydovora]
MSINTKNVSIKVEEVNKITSKYMGEEPDYIALLQEIQDKFRYLPKDALKICSEKLNIPLSRLYSLATFYSCFSLTPKGKFEIHVCMGTACHVRKAPKMLDKISDHLHIKPGETTKDQNFSLETVNCVGACALGPLITVNGKYRGNLTVNQVDSILKELEEQVE